MLIPVTLMMEATCSSKTLALKEPHGVTSQQTAFFSNFFFFQALPSSLERSSLGITGRQTHCRDKPRNHHVRFEVLTLVTGFHGGDYEECHLLGYKIPVCTSQETHYISATDASQLMLRKISPSFHGGD
jgi:hypothetical protein